MALDILKLKKNCSVSCPDNILVIGGGRWARVLIDTLCNLVHSNVRINIYSAHNASLMSKWVSKHDFDVQVCVSSDLDKLFFSDSTNIPYIY